MAQLDPRVAATFFGQFKELRPLQKAAIPPLAAGKNLVLSAGTGSGKTEAVVAPLVSRYWVDAVRSEKTFLLYVSPTKALINDLSKRLCPLLEELGLRVVVRHGDRDELGAAAAHVIITTPESLNILLMKGEERLLDIQAVVVDEVHLLYNTQRGLQLALSLHRLKKLARRPLQWAALSATISRLKDVRDFLFGPWEDCVIAEFPSVRALDAHIIMFKSPEDMRATILRLMDYPRRKLLVFANSRRACEEVAKVLQGVPQLRECTMTHYSSLSPELRESTERLFAKAPRAICVATSTLELGIDIGDIDAVVLWGVPPGIESFLQRIGRGNRRANKTNAICLVPPGPDALKQALVFSTLTCLARQGKMPVTAPLQLYGAVAQQIASILFAKNGAYTRIADFADDLGAFAHLDRQVIESILAEMAEDGLMQRHGFKNRYGAADGLWELADKGMLFGNFPIGSQTVDIRHGQRLIGTIPLINLMKITKGTNMRFAGKSWRVLAAAHDGIVVEPASRSRRDEITPVYGESGSGAGGWDSFISNHLWARLFNIEQSNCDMPKSTWEPVKRFVDSIRAACKPESLPYARTHGGFVYFTFGGAFFNSVLSKFTGAARPALSAIAVQSATPLDFGTLPSSTAHLLDAARSLFVGGADQTYFQQCLPYELQEKEFCDCWLKDEEAQQVLKRLRAAPLQEVSPTLFGPLLQDSQPKRT
ncbi:MAG: DEAD/DEAH box helicase [Verrucomicrobia bacterium]|nr:DEAD/DEAH box helicase [Verrucomicrobiota bacterium]